MTRPVPIGEALYREAERLRHQELFEYAEYQISKSDENKPRDDTGERFIRVQELIDDERDSLNQFQEEPLFRVVLDYGERGKVVPVIEYPPLPWENDDG